MNLLSEKAWQVLRFELYGSFPNCIHGVGVVAAMEGRCSSCLERRMVLHVSLVPIDDVDDDRKDFDGDYPLRISCKK